MIATLTHRQTARTTKLRLHGPLHGLWIGYKNYRAAVKRVGGDYISSDVTFVVYDSSRTCGPRILVEARL